MLSSAWRKRFMQALVAILLLSSIAAAQQKPEDEGEQKELTKQVQNPVSRLISVPLQNNSNFGIGPLDRTQNVLNIQPVIPSRLGENWNLITRVVMPVVLRPNLNQRDASIMGLGDINPTFFLSPARRGKLIWGIGPDFVLPTATNSLLGQGKWSGGPAVVALVQPDPWSIGVLINNVWSFAGESDKPAVNQLLLQYFLNYNLKKGWYIALQPIITANWKATNGNTWTVPFGGGVGRVFRLVYQPVNVTLQFYGNAVHPAGASPWSMRVQMAFLYPKKPKEP